MRAMCAVWGGANGKEGRGKEEGKEKGGGGTYAFLGLLRS